MITDVTIANDSLLIILFTTFGCRIYLSMNLKKIKQGSEIYLDKWNSLDIKNKQQQKNNLKLIRGMTEHQSKRALREEEILSVRVTIPDWGETPTHDSGRQLRPLIGLTHPGIVGASGEKFFLETCVICRKCASDLCNKALGFIYRDYFEFYVNWIHLSCSPLLCKKNICI